VLEVLYDVVRGLVAMATGPHVIVHRDLHIRNILMKGGRAKISDFGCGRIVLPNDTDQTSWPGCIPITPPEAATSLPFSSSRLSPSYDIYGYGLLMAQVANRLKGGDEE